MPSGDARDKKTNEAEMILVNEAVIAPLYFSVENHYRNPDIKGIIRRSITGITDFNYGYMEKQFLNCKKKLSKKTIKINVKETVSKKLKNIKKTIFINYLEFYNSNRK